MPPSPQPPPPPRPHTGLFSNSFETSCPVLTRPLFTPHLFVTFVFNILLAQKYRKRNHRFSSPSSTASSYQQFYYRCITFLRKKDRQLCYCGSRSFPHYWCASLLSFLYLSFTNLCSTIFQVDDAKNCLLLRRSLPLHSQPTLRVWW